MKSKTYEVIIAGGGPAGLSAALILGRCRRRVLLIDAGYPRNRYAAQLNGYLTRDGTRPHRFLELAREDIRHYNVPILADEVVSVEKRNGVFFLQTQHNGSYQSDLMLLATGVADRLPDLPGIEEYYGKSVFHCPYCDGYEVHMKPVFVYAEKPKSCMELCLNLQNWSQKVQLLSGYVKKLTADAMDQLQQQGVKILRGKVAQLLGKKGMLKKIIMDTGEEAEGRALFFSTGSSQASSLARNAGCELTAHGGIRHDKFQMTSVEGLYVAGDMDKEMQLAIVAAAEGAKAGVMIHSRLNNR